MRINIEIRNTCHGGILSDICRETGQKCRYGKNNSAFLSITILYFQVLFMLNRLIDPRQTTKNKDYSIDCVLLTSLKEIYLCKVIIGQIVSIVRPKQNKA